MQSVRRVTVAVVWLLAAAFLISVSAWGRSGPAAPLGRYAVGFDSLPGSLAAGDSYIGAEVERVDRVLRFVRVAVQNFSEFLIRARRQASVR